jgi:threonine dehydratase
VLANRGVTGIAVSEENIRAAQRWAVEKLHLVIEPGGAVALAAMLAGKVPAEAGMLVILSGGNTDAASFGRALTGEAARIAEPA